MSSLIVDDLKSRIASDPIFAHNLLFQARHTNEPAPFHADMIRLLHGPVERVVILSFRGSAKSTLAEEALIIKALTGAYRYCVICCATLGRAQDRLRSIKNEIQNNDLIEEIFGRMEGDTWQVDRIVLASGVCIDALGCGQSTRGLKYLSERPSFALVDDLEEANLNLDNVSTPEKRQEISNWFMGVFLPSLSRPAPNTPPSAVRVCGTMLHPESLIGRMSRSPDYEAMIVPVEHIDQFGNRASSWPSQFPLSFIDETRSRYEREGAQEVFGQEFLCQAASPQARAFKEEHLRFDETPRSGEPCHVIYDPARTAVPGKSCATGKIVASWVANRLLVWEATEAFWQPDELIDDVFKSMDKWNPISIGVEETGLNQFLMQPLRQASIRRGSIPLRALNPPRGPGKENFLLRLQPFFSAGEVIFRGPRQKFQALIDELLGFPYGLKDSINALAYMLEIRSGEPVFPSFTRSLVRSDPGPRDPRGRTNILLLNGDVNRCVAVMAIARAEALHIVSDCLEEGSPAVVLPGMIRQARALVGAGSLVCYAPSRHWKPYNDIGLPPAAARSGVSLMRGGDRVAGRDELQARMKQGDAPLFSISPEARWTVQAFSGGYSYSPGDDHPTDNEYGLVSEAIECLMPVISGGLDGEDYYNRVTPDGRPYLSSMVPLRRERAKA